MKTTLKMKQPKKYYVELLTDIQFSQFENDELLPFYRKLKMDVLLPSTNRPLPAILFIDGGRFLRVNKTRCLPELIKLAESGYVVATMEYRTSNEDLFPSQLYDAKTAVRFLRAHADKFNINSNHIGVLGKSAGATIGNLLALTGDDHELEGNGEWKEYSSSVQAAVDLYGVIDLVKFEMDSPATAGSLLIGESVHKNKEKANKVNPISYLSGESPPFLIFHGVSDQVVPISQSDLFYEALEKVGADVDYYRVEGAGHNLKNFTTKTEFLEIVRGFFDEKLKEKVWI